MKLAQLQLPGGTLPPPNGIPTQLQGGLNESGKRILQVGLQWLFIIAAVLALIFIIFSGIEWITSAGDPSKIAAAKKRLMYSIIGLIVVATAFLIVRLVFSTLGVAGTQPYI